MEPVHHERYGLTRKSYFKATKRTQAGQISTSDRVYSNFSCETDPIFIYGIEHGAISAIITLRKKPDKNRQAKFKKDHIYNTKRVVKGIKTQHNSLLKTTTRYFQNGKTHIQTHRVGNVQEKLKM